MSNVPADLKYTEEHEWIRTENDGTLTIGITDHAQSTLGDIVFFELSKVGSQVRAGDAVGVVESGAIVETCGSAHWLRSPSRPAEQGRRPGGRR
ncbi:glycine cleavage system protein H [Streptomyces noursei]|uniref:glycine cleavage system protein H n=1 Tax=Streptomyces noursei TaxID=1971 RepID=UPI0019995441|nr:hypothetical protein GCM10010341_51550 [Streptomyces noursei]